jgi:outer membrane protein assembly factor BamA
LKNFIQILFSAAVILNFAFAQNEDIDFRAYKLDDITVEYTGTQNFNESDIKALLKTGKAKYFDYTEFCSDILRIEKFYFDNGFIDASVDTSIIINEADKEISAKFIIDEKNPYLINFIDYQGLSVIGGAFYGKLFQEDEPLIKTGNRFNKNLLGQEISRIMRFLNNNGYAYATNEQPEIIKTESNNPDRKYKFDIVLKFTPGEFYKFGKTKIFIENNKYNISFEEVYRELDYIENDYYSKDKLMESENRINRISILENARIQVDNIDTVSNIINMKINANVRNKYELQPEILGYNINNLFYAGGGMGFSDRYFFGGGRTFTAKLEGLVHSENINGIDFSMNMFQPYIFKNNKITGEWKIGATLFNQDEFRIVEAKNEFNINFELPKHTYVNSLQLSWKLSDMRYTVKQPVPSEITNGIVDTIIILPVNSFINTFSSILGFTVTHNSTNSFQFPSKGFIQSYLFEESGLLGSLARNIFDISTFSYFKFTTVHKFFFNLANETNASVLASKTLLGVIFEYGDNTLKVSGVENDLNMNFIPIETRFIAGGNTSVRGWPGKKLGAFANMDNGGNFLFEGNLEHRTKPFRNLKNIFRDLGFVTFFDYGNLWEYPSKFQFQQIALAIGAGIRYYTIVGPIRVDFGFKLYDYFAESGTNKWLFNNSLSTILKSKLTIQFGIGNTF